MKPFNVKIIAIILFGVLLFFMSPVIVLIIIAAILLIRRFKPEIFESVFDSVKKYLGVARSLTSESEKTEKSESTTYTNTYHSPSQLSSKPMKVTISIDQQSKSSMFGLGGKKHSYKLNFQFKLGEKEKKIFNEHPLFQEMTFMQYTIPVGMFRQNEEVVDITAKDIYSGTPVQIETRSVNEIIDLREQIDTAARSFIQAIDILSDIVGEKELSYGE